MSLNYPKSTSLSLLLLASISAFAGDTKINRGDLPAAVEKTVQEQSAGATIKGFSKETEHGQLSYEVEMTIDGHGKDVSIAKDGSILAIEEEIAFESLPTGVQSALTKKAQGAKIDKVESVTKKGKLYSYEATTLKGTRKGEVAVGPNGEKLMHED